MAKVAIIGPAKISGITRLQNQVKEKVAKQAGTQFTRTLGRETSKHYANAVKQMGGILRYPHIGPINVAQRHNIKFTHVDGSTGSVFTNRWSPLNEDYAKRRPRSTSFWGKTGILFTHFTSMPKAHATAKTVQSRATSKGFLVEAEVTLSRLPSPMNILITKAFLEGTKGNTLYLPSPLSTKGINRNSVQRAAFAEARRPLVSRVTSALGRKLLEVLRSK